MKELIGSIDLLQLKRQKQKKEDKEGHCIFFSPWAILEDFINSMKYPEKM